MISALVLVCLFKGQTQPYKDIRISIEITVAQRAEYDSLDTSAKSAWLSDFCSELNHGKDADDIYTVEAK